MKVQITINMLFIFLSLLFSFYCKLEEGSIYLPMTSNFTLEQYKNRVYNKNYFTITLNIGNPPEEYELQLDTSTSTSWISSSRCKNCILARRLYDPEDSRTSSPTDKFIKIEDEDGDVEGYQAADDFTLGTYKLKQFSFVEVTKLADNFMDHHQGKLGLGYGNYFLKNEEFNFLERLSKNSLIKKKIFTISTINDKKGMLFIGDVPGKEYKTFCNVTETDELDDTYKESWVCEMSHVGIFDKEKGMFNRIKMYEELKNNKFVSFDSAYDYISVPISEKETIEKMLSKANLECKSSKKTNNIKLSNALRHRLRDEEITIICKTNEEELKKKNMAISFLLQDFAYSIPLENLFVKAEKEGRMEMLIKYIDDESAIWTFGFPFFNQFLMIFNMEDKHVGMKKLKKTALPIVDVYDKYSVKEEKTSTAFKVFGYFILLLVVIAILFFVYHAIRKNNLNSKNDLMNNENNAQPIF